MANTDDKGYFCISGLADGEYQGEGMTGMANIVLKDNANYGVHRRAAILGGNCDRPATYPSQTYRKS